LVTASFSYRLQKLPGFPSTSICQTGGEKEEGGIKDGPSKKEAKNKNFPNNLFKDKYEN
jgi:hypothetical protein